MKTTDLKILTHPPVIKECIDRIGNLDLEATPTWGTMTAAQMLAHCAEVIEVANGKELRHMPFYIRLLKPIVRRMVTGRKPYARNTQTAPQYRQLEERDFDVEKARLLLALEAFVRANSGGATHSVHPFFGRISVEELGWAMYKHLDHHLGQFGVGYLQ